MALNTITIEFTPCEPTPANGYRIYYRPVGGGAYRFHPDRFYVSPAVFTDEEDPIGTSYEGFIQGDCGGEKYGLPIPWTAENNESGGGSGSGSISEPPAEGCRSYVLSKTVGTPSAHYNTCAGVSTDTLINDHTSICTDGNGFTISGGGIVVNSFTDGVCGALSNAFKYGGSSGAACAATPTSLWWFGPNAALTPGTIMYTDGTMTTPLLGQSFISDSVGTEVFQMNPSTGAIIGTTGSGC